MKTMTTYADARRARAAPPLWRTISGWTCLALGVLGLALPLLPGIPLLFAGLFLLSTSYQWARRSRRWLRSRIRKLADLKPADLKKARSNRSTAIR
jgi:hypothetical protein